MLLGNEACTDVGVLENCDKFLQENRRKVRDNGLQDAVLKISYRD